MGCTIQNAIINQTVISINNCSVKISGNTFNDAADMAHENVAITTSGGSSIISNNYFTECGIDISDSSTIDSNIITGGMGLYGGSPVVSNNQISGRSSYFLIGRSFDRDYDTIAIMRGSPVVSGNNVSGVIGFNAHENGDNGIGAFNHALISGNIINEGCIYGVGIDIIAGTGSIDIISNIISDISTGINVSNTTAVLVKIQGNLIVDSNITAISATDNAIIQNNTLAKSGTGITLNNAVSPMISGNNIENSNQYTIQLKGTSSNIDAANNWWGTTDTKVISQNIL
jgi:Periplasmic copper-binding protein (NosD)